MSELFSDLNERIADFERRMAELQAEIDQLPQGLERREALDAIAEVARALAALKQDLIRVRLPHVAPRQDASTSPPTVSRIR